MFITGDDLIAINENKVKENRDTNSPQMITYIPKISKTKRRKVKKKLEITKKSTNIRLFQKEKTVTQNTEVLNTNPDNVLNDHSYSDKISEDNLEFPSTIKDDFNDQRANEKSIKNDVEIQNKCNQIEEKQDEDNQCDTMKLYELKLAMDSMRKKIKWIICNSRNVLEEKAMPVKEYWEESKESFVMTKKSNS
jgi:hypothetical protein